MEAPSGKHFLQGTSFTQNKNTHKNIQKRRTKLDEWQQNDITTPTNHSKPTPAKPRKHPNISQQPPITLSEDKTSNRQQPQNIGLLSRAHQGRCDVNDRRLKELPRGQNSKAKIQYLRNFWNTNEELQPNDISSHCKLWNNPSVQELLMTKPWKTWTKIRLC